MTRKPAPDAARARFAALLAGHLTRGTRPAKAEGEPWTDAAFAAEVQSSREDNDFVSPRSVSNWRKGKALPAAIEPILRALFGPTDRHAEARAALLAAFRTARAEASSAALARAKPHPAGTKWVEQGSQLVMDRTARPSDQRAAADPLQQQLQTASRDMAARLAGATSRDSNSFLLDSLSVAATAFSKLLDCPPPEMATRVASAYALSVELGQVLETDARILDGEPANDPPLDPVIRGMLTNLVRIAAPWLRGFPTVVALDDKAGSFHGEQKLLQPSLKLIQLALDQELIPAQDATEILCLARAADPRGYQGQKAGNLAVGHVTNLLLKAACMFAASITGAGVADFEARLKLIQRISAMLAAAGKPIDAFADTMAADLRQAFRALVDEARKPELPAPVVLPSKIVPVWADDADTDKYGRWASFYLPDADGARVEQRLRWCPPGRFMMGSPEDEEGRIGWEGPRHEVVFARGFWLFETACRQELWQAVMGDNPSSRKGPLLPVTDVSWDDARRFVERLNARPGLGLDLPSEAQWEYACRAGTDKAYSFGPKISRKLVNYDRKGTVPVGSLPPNPWGLHEMHGNVEEWCADPWHDNYNGAPADGSAWIGGGAALRVVRGGSWFGLARSVRAGFRNHYVPSFRDDLLGFRCARVQRE